MPRVIRAYWSYLQRRATAAESLGGRLIELRWQTVPWFIALGALIGIPALAFELPPYLIVAAGLILVAAIIFIGSAIAAVPIDEDAPSHIRRED
jgi:hypothetical protein